MREVADELNKNLEAQKTISKPAALWYNGEKGVFLFFAGRAAHIIDGGNRVPPGEENHG